MAAKVEAGVSAGHSASGQQGGLSATRKLLACGVLVGPFYLLVGLIQALVRDGFDLARHPLSLLANGSGGWVQSANFVLSGLLVIAASVGIGRALRRESRLAGWVLGCFGASMIAAAVFPADPVDGFPIGTPEGFPTAISTPGMLHFVAGGLGFLALGVSCFVIAAALRRRDRWLARLSFLSGLAVLGGFFGPMFLPLPFPGIAGIWFSVVAGWAWLAVLTARLYRGAATLNVA